MTYVCWNVLVRMEHDCGQAKEREEGSEPGVYYSDL